MRRPPPLDLAVAGALMVAAVVVPDASGHRPTLLGAVVGVVWVAPVVLRTVAPLAMAVLTATIGVAYALLPLHPEPIWAFVAAGIVAYSIGLGLTGRRRVAATLVLLVGYALVSQLDSVGRDFEDRDGSTLPGVLGPVLAGAVVERVRRQRTELRRLTDALHAEREAHLRDAAAAERNRIAGELHDVISHSVSQMMVQAAAAHQLLDPGSPVRRQVAVVRETGREALAELRRQLGLLREGPLETPAPMPSLADVPALVAAAGAGLDWDAELAEVAPGTGLTAYRVVQEALTNARKHAAGAGAEVRVGREHDDLVVEVVNGPGGRAIAERSAGTGHGLLGMRERVTRYGGCLHAGPSADGGWRVLTTLPLPPVPVVQPVAT